MQVHADHSTFIRVGDEEEPSPPPPGSADDFLIERVFAKVKPPAVVATDLYDSKNEPDTPTEVSQQHEKDEESSQEVEAPKNGRLLQTAENTNVFSFVLSTNSSRFTFNLCFYFSANVIILLCNYLKRLSESTL